MNTSSQHAYRENQVLTATPQKLQLMLIEGALRFARQGLEGWRTGEDEAAAEALVRCRKILSNIQAEIKPERGEAAQRTSSLYLYLFQTLTFAQMNHSTQDLKDIIKVLEIERETWSRLCEQMPDAPTESQRDTPTEVTARDMPVVPTVEMPISEGFTAEA
jgi:flagellar protein FliS